MKTRKKKGWMPALFVFGSVFTVSGVYLLAEQLAFERSAKRTTGTIVALWPDDHYKRRNYFIPTVEYVAGKNEQVCFDGRPTYLDRSATQEVYVTGKSVPVIYQPGDPLHARIDNESQRWNEPKGILLLGLGCLTAASLMLWRRIKMTGKQDASEAGVRDISNR